MPRHTDVQLQNLLAAVTDALLSGEADVDSQIEEYDDETEATLSLIRLIDHLGQVLVPVTPSPQFVSRLRQDLVGTDTGNVLVKVRHLPPRVHIAAGLALVAGFVFLRRRRSLSEADSTPAETAAAQ